MQYSGWFCRMKKRNSPINNTDRYITDQENKDKHWLFYMRTLSSTDNWCVQTIGSFSRTAAIHSVVILALRQIYERFTRLFLLSPEVYSWDKNIAVGQVHLKLFYRETICEVDCGMQGKKTQGVTYVLCHCSIRHIKQIMLWLANAESKRKCAISNQNDIGRYCLNISSEDPRSQTAQSLPWKRQHPR